MTTMHEPSPAHQIQAHVVEEIMPEQLTEVTDVKEVINQLIPTRKRKPRTKKRKSENSSKFANAIELAEIDKCKQIITKLSIG